MYPTALGSDQALKGSGIQSPKRLTQLVPDPDLQIKGDFNLRALVIFLSLIVPRLYRDPQHTWL